MLVPGNAEGKSGPVPARHRDQSSPKTDWDAQCKSDSVLAKHVTRAVQRERVAQSDSEQGSVSE